MDSRELSEWMALARVEKEEEQERQEQAKEQQETQKVVQRAEDNRKQAR